MGADLLGSHHVLYRLPGTLGTNGHHQVDRKEGWVSCPTNPSHHALQRVAI